MVYALILTISWLGLLPVIFCKFVIELWPFIGVRISFPLNMFRMNRQNWTKFCKCIDIDKIVTCDFSHFYKRVMPLD